MLYKLTIIFVGTKKELEVDKSAVNLVGKRGGGGGGGHGGGGHSGGSHGSGSRGNGGYRAYHVIPVYAGGHRQNRHGHRNSSSRNSITISQLVSSILALALLLT